MLLKPFVVPFFALTLATQQPSDVDWLDTGIVFAGPVRFERVEDSTHFTLIDGESTVQVKVDTERAFPTTPNTSMSYRWAQKLSTARSASLRIADRRDVAIETTYRRDSLGMVLCVRPAPLERTSKVIYYGIQCVAFDEERRITTAKDGLIFEVNIVVFVPSHSTADTFLSRPRERIYVRLEP
jgi:hypothetical protein